ncbi:UNVERIFIED_CONTAM: hypothetical protein Cloal_3511 [Acetivibrio alkalicellulosi]
MKDIILDRLGKMEDLEQRKMLKNVLYGVFSNLIDYQEVANRSLEERVFNEIEDRERRYDIFVTVNNIENVDPVDEFLFPIIPEDLEEKEYNMGEVSQKLYKKEDVTLFTLFMNCDYLKIKEILRSKKTYIGEIVTDKQSYPIKIRLEQNLKYIDEIERLYIIFQKNSMPWKTVNNPYANKFFDVVMTECEGILDAGEMIKEIKVNLEEYERYKQIGVIPLWNVKRISMKNDGFPMPAIDKVNFEHIISLKKIGVDDGYLVDEDEKVVKYIMRTEDNLNIVSPEEKAGAWNVLKIAGQGKEQPRKLEYELISNSRKKSFINNFIQKHATLIRTRGEIARIVSSFEVSDYFELVGIEILDSKSKKGITYDMNSFIVDDIRIANDKKVMSLKFSAIKKESIIIYDILSFLISEIQMYFPEYECEGEFL